jgi:hypothetical protein
VEFLRKLAHSYGSLGFALQAAIVVGLALVTTAIGVGMVIWIPADHFLPGRPEPTSWWRSHPVLRGGGLVIKNVMALPLVPGPGFVFILLGLSLLDFPGKRNLERRLLGVPSVVRFLNEVRGRFGRAPLVLESPDSARRPGDV